MKKISEQPKLVQIMSVLIVIGIVIITARACSIEKVPYDTFVQNRCEQYPDQTEYFSQNTFELYVDHDSRSQVVYNVPFCENIKFEIQLDFNDGLADWIMIKAIDGSDYMGWQRKDFLEPRVLEKKE